MNNLLCPRNQSNETRRTCAWRTYYLYINQYSFVVDVASLHTSVPSNIDIIKLRFAAAGWKGLLCLRQTTRGADNILVYINARRGRGNMWRRARHFMRINALREGYDWMHSLEIVVCGWVFERDKRGWGEGSVANKTICRDWIWVKV